MSFKPLVLHKSWSPLIATVRWCNKKEEHAFPKWHLEPITSKFELEKLEVEGKLEPLKVIPVKPCPSNKSDSIFYDPLFSHFTNMVMMWSNRILARKLLHETFARIKRIQLAKYHNAPPEEKSSIVLDPMVIFKQAIENCQPILALTPIKKGGITYQVPVPITPKKSQWMAMKWLIMAGRDKEGEISFVQQMSQELLDAFHKEGRVIKRKQDLHKICENNKAYAHYRWS